MGEFEQAIGFYNQAIEKDPTNVSFITNIAAVQMAEKKYDEAIETCKRAIAKAKEVFADYSTKAKCYTRLGTCYMKKKEYAKAITEFENAQLEDKTRAVAKKLLKAHKAKDRAEVLAYQDPEKAKAAKDEGNAFFKANNFPKAIECYKEAIKRNPNEPTYYQNRSAAYSKMMAWGMALKDCEKALELDPKYVKAWARKAKIEHFLKKHHKALDSAQKGLAIDPSDKMCMDQLIKTQRTIQENMSKPADEDAINRAQEDPEIRAILADPVVKTVIQDMSTNPGAAQKHMSNPGMAEKINKLIASGILRTGGP